MEYIILLIWLALWVGFAIYGFGKRWSGIVSIGGGFFTACAVVAVMVSMIGDKTTADTAGPVAEAGVAHVTGQLNENGLICNHPENVGEFLLRLEKHGSFETPGCLLNTSNQKIPVLIIHSSYINGEDVTEAKVSLDKASFWTLTSHLATAN